MTLRPSRSLPLLLAVLALAPLRAQDADAGRALANRVAAACGLAAWEQVDTVRFTWRHVPSRRDRGYDWNVPQGTVKVTMGETPVEVPVAGWPATAEPTEAQLAAHKAWVNDGFWALSALHLAWDQVEGFDALEAGDVPGFPKLGKRRALRVRYGASGGYTPGDHYVLYLGDDDRPVAWAFHKAGAEDAKFVMGWETYRVIGGVAFPTRFTTPDGSLVIAIEGIGVSQRQRSPASRPTSRPTGGR